MKELLYRFFGPDPDVLNAYRNVIPNSIRIHQEDDNGSIIVKIIEINNDELDDSNLIITQVNKKTEVVPAVNDLIMTYFDIPSELRRYYEKQLVLEGHLNTESTLVKA